MEAKDLRAKAEQELQELVRRIQLFEQETMRMRERSVQLVGKIEAYKELEPADEAAEAASAE